MEHIVGLIGGSGLYQLPGITDLKTLEVDTPFGAPSGPLTVGRLGSVQLVFIARHGPGHTLLPSEVPYRANIFALKQQGVSWAISVSAVGSLREDIAPGDVVLPDQFIDRTKGIRDSTFFGKGVVAHVPFGDPICSTLRRHLYDAAVGEGATVHNGGTYVAMEGPAFSTRAESQLYRSWGGSVIGMTNLPEAKLAREAGLSYATLAMATDYDCWHPQHDQVNVAQIIETLMANVSLAQKIVARALPQIASHRGPNPHHDALANAIITQPDAMNAQTRDALWPLIGRFV